MSNKRKSKKTPQHSKTSKGIITVFVLLFLATAAVGMWWHWGEITGKDNSGGDDSSMSEEIELNPDELYF